MNFFSTDSFLHALAAAWWPGQRSAIELFTLEGKTFRLLVIDGKQVVRNWAFFDFAEPLAPGSDGPSRPLDYLPWTVLRTTPSERKFAAGSSRLRPAPFIQWAQFPDRAAFEAHTGTKERDSRQRRKKVEKDLGPLLFTFDDPSPEAFEQCLKWKSAQYLATGNVDLFADPRQVEMFRLLREKKVAVVSSLRAGTQLIAAHLGALADQRFYWWVPAYDATLHKYSPGRLLLEAALAESQERSHLEFDFLIGDEDYKWHYATHNREIGPLGQPPLALRVQEEAKKRLKGALARFPRALDLARDLRKRLTR